MIIKLLIILFILLIPIKVNASPETYIVMDMERGRVLEGNKIYQEKLTASISKIMTAVIALNKGDPNKQITVNDSVLKSYGSGIYIKVGEQLLLKDLLYGLLLRSGNDAALMIADYISGSTNEFANEMNKYAKIIGMNHSEFINPSGLEENNIGNISCAYDMALLMKNAMQNPLFREIIKTKYYKLSTNLNDYYWKNKNKLLFNYEYTTGGKTGFTKKARRTLVTSASKDNVNLVIVTFNDGDDFNTHKNLYQKYFNKLINKILIKQDEILYEDNKYKLVSPSDCSVNVYNDEDIKINLINDKENSYIDVIINNKKVEACPVTYQLKKQKNISKFKLWQTILWGVNL